VAVILSKGEPAEFATDKIIEAVKNLKTEEEAQNS